MIKTLDPTTGITKPLFSEQVNSFSTSGNLVYYTPKSSPRKVIGFNVNNERRTDVMELAEPASHFRITVAGL